MTLLCAQLLALKLKSELLSPACLRSELRQEKEGC